MALPEETWLSDFTGVEWTTISGWHWAGVIKAEREQWVHPPLRNNKRHQDVQQQPQPQRVLTWSCVGVYNCAKCVQCVDDDWGIWRVCPYNVVWLLVICLYCNFLFCISRNRQCGEMSCRSSPQVLARAPQFRSPCRLCAWSAGKEAEKAFNSQCETPPIRTPHFNLTHQ